MSWPRFRTSLVLLFGLASAFWLAQGDQPALAGATFTATRFDDPVPDGCQPADCSLREAVVAANEDPGLDTITVTNLNDSGPGSLRQAVADTAPGDTIDFAVAGTITLTSGGIYIYSGVNIDGPGAGTLTISGNNSSGIFSVYAAGPVSAVSISDLTMRDGYASAGGGGALYTTTGSTVTLERVIVRDNTSSGSAGGIGNNGALTIRDSTISGNSVVNIENAGGGIFSQTGATLEISGTTIAGNTATNQGGGIFINGGTATITNTTISGNTDSGIFGGGGIANFGNLTLANVTITGNHTNQAGGGLANWTGSGAAASVKNTIIAGNTAGADGPDCMDTLNSLGHNLVGDMSGCEFSGDTTGNLTGVDPELGPLADNGGPTQTHALLAGSPAINAGDDDVCPPTDQRGVARPQGTACDIGAFEFEGSPVELLQGDVNCDHEVNAVDALFILRAVAQLLPLAECLDLAGDVNCDSDRTAVDALFVLRYVADLPVSQNEDCPHIGTPV